MDIYLQLFVNAVITSSLYALAAFGLSLIYGLFRVLNFAHGHILMVGAYAFYFAHVTLEQGAAVSGIWSAGAVILLGVLMFHLFIAPFLQYNFLLVLISSLALSYILESLVVIIFGATVKSLLIGSLHQSIMLGPIYITPIQLMIIGSALTILPAFAFVLHKTRIGRIVRAVSDNSAAAQALGISEKKVIYSVVIFATLLTGYAGILVGMETNLQPQMGAAYTIKAFAALVLGGLGNLWGTLAGAFILGFVENTALGVDIGGWHIPAGYKDAFAFLLILFTLLWRPEGLFGRKLRGV